MSRTFWTSQTPRTSRLVHTLSGIVQGKTYTFKDGTCSSAFLGIPYAEPPVGQLRFKKPVPVKRWVGVKKCTEFGASCHQKNEMRKIRSSEDCLFLNVFAPEPRSTTDESVKNLPVLFYVHGGGFLIDSSTVLGDRNICKYLCSRGVIVVTFNYRLGFFGFLTLGSKEAPGNYALWDMTMALEWVYENIASFGGDPNLITAIGQSAGAAAVDLLGYIKQEIMFAGSSYCSFVSFDQKSCQEFALEYAKFKGFVVDTNHTKEEQDEALLNFFKKAKAKDLALSILLDPRFEYRSKVLIGLSPVIDHDFFPKSLDELRKEAPNKKFISGTTEYEAVDPADSHPNRVLMLIGGFILRNVLGQDSFIGRRLLKSVVRRKQRFKSLEEIYRLPLTKLFHLVRPDLGEQTVERILDELLDSSKPDDEYIKEVVNLISDILVVYGAYQMSMERARHGDTVFTYCFKYYKPGSIGLLSETVPFEAATHCLELPYFFGKNLIGEFVPNRRDKAMLDKFTTYLIQFAKTGDPNNQKYNEKWSPFSLDNHERYFLFDEEYGMRDNCTNGRLASWQRIFEHYPKPA